MKNKGFFVLASLVAFVLVVGLACSVGSTPTPIPPTPIPTAVKPTQAPPTPEQPTQPPQDTSGGWTTFTDQNDLYQIQVPGDWVYKQVTGDYYYIDQFKSPDAQALVENIAYNDGTPFTGSQNGKFALNLLNKFYSKTGETGDIRVLGDQIQKDGSERLEWVSKAGGYKGYSYFETRGSDNATFLMITIEWMNSAEDNYIDTLNTIIESYRIP